MAYSTSGGRMSGEGPALKKRPSPEQCANCWRWDNGNTRPGGPRRRQARTGRIMLGKTCIRRPKADRRGTASAVRGNFSPVPQGGGRGDREVGQRSCPISRGETKTAASSSAVSFRRPNAPDLEPPLPGRAATPPIVHRWNRLIDVYYKMSIFVPRICRWL